MLTQIALKALNYVKHISHGAKFLTDLPVESGGGEELSLRVEAHAEDVAAVSCQQHDGRQQVRRPLRTLGLPTPRDRAGR